MVTVQRDMADSPRVCVIGAGPCSMSFLYHRRKLEEKGFPFSEVVCYEKQANWGGLWNFTWRTGIDEYGEPCHGSMYHDPWSNGPKECLEFPDYTFFDHFGRVIPSFPPRTVLFDYLQGRWTKADLRGYIRFSTVVKHVAYNRDTNLFTVTTRDLANDRDLPPEMFSHVIVATGHFSFPNVPDFAGMETFPGNVIHSHDFRTAAAFRGEKILVVGSSYSADDIAMQCKKMGSGNVIVSWRTKPTGFRWPEGIEERPLLTKIDDRTVHFKDGTSAEVDSIILCTEYKYHYPFLPDSLRLKTSLLLYPAGLYKGTIWMNDGNNKLMYLGMQDQYYSFTMFDVQAEWACKVIKGILRLPERKGMENDIEKWIKDQDALKNCYDDIVFQTKFVVDLAKLVGCKSSLDVKDYCNKWEDYRHSDLVSYRDHAYDSKFSKKEGIKHCKPWYEEFDDSLETFVNQTPSKSPG